MVARTIVQRKNTTQLMYLCTYAVNQSADFLMKDIWRIRRLVWALAVLS